jgi:membrane protease YdiL (CAAX protease family)
MTGGGRVLDEHAGRAARTPVRGRTAWARFLAGFAVLYGVLAVTGAAVETGRWGLLVLAVVLGSAAVVERVLHGAAMLGAPRRLGLGNPGWRSPVLALGIAALIVLVHPLSAAVTGAPGALRADWPWLLVGTFAFHGVAEELVWRGYAFRRLREGRSFRSAVWLTMPLIAATHLPIVVDLGLAIGLGAMLVAAVTALPLSHLYEGGRNTLWAPAIVHTSIDSFTLVVLPSAATTTFSLLLVAMSVVVPLLVLAVPRQLLQQAPRPGPDAEVARDGR